MIFLGFKNYVLIGWFISWNNMSNYYYEQSSSSTSNQSESSNSNVETKLVTVQDKSSSHPYFGQGSSKGYFIDG